MKTHVSRMLSKLGLGGRTQAVVTAYGSGLVVPRSREPGQPRVRPFGTARGAAPRAPHAG